MFAIEAFREGRFSARAETEELLLFEDRLEEVKGAGLRFLGLEK
jgi:hypothetical protein